MDFTAYAGSGNDREVLRWITDEIMNAVMELSGQVYVDAYGASVKSAMDEGRVFDTKLPSRPGEGRTAPPVPALPQVVAPS
jgi:1-acyl-sn-glycerol-3-phosphate acyltransferase